MRLLSAGLIYVAVSTVAALLLGENAGGLNWSISFVSLIIGATGAIAVFFLMPPSSEGFCLAAEDDDPLAKYRSIWLCLVGFVFAIFAFRSFCWLFYFDGENIDIQSPFNLGDLGLHLTYIKTFANGMSLWPDSPIYVYSKLRYPAGIDLFNGILTNLGFALRHQLASTGLSAFLVLFLTRPAARSSVLKLVAAAVLPAAIFIWLTTDRMRAGSILQWHFGWTQNVGELKMPFFSFWVFNFGVFLPLAIALTWIVARQESSDFSSRQSSAPELKQPGLGLLDSVLGRARKFELSIDAAYLAAAVLIFLLTISVKTAPWEWDNIKLLIWSYFINLPILWNRMLISWPFSAQVGACLVLFFSGFVSLIGGLAAGRPGY